MTEPTTTCRICHAERTEHSLDDTHVYAPATPEPTSPATDFQCRTCRRWVLAAYRVGDQCRGCATGDQRGVVTTAPTARDYAREVQDRIARETTAREATAELLAQAIEASAEPTLQGALQTQEWRLVSGNQTELTIRRPDGITLKIVVTAQEAE